MIEILEAGPVMRVHMHTRRTRVVGYSVSAYLMDGVLIDTGFPGVAGEFARLLDELKPRGVILTHHHEDHAGNMQEVARRGIPIAAPEESVRRLRAGEVMGGYRRFVWSQMPHLTAAITPFDPGALQLVHTPGHSSDHHVVFDAERGIMIAGDLFLGVKVRVARPGEDPVALVSSLRRAAALRPRHMLDAHRGEIRDPAGSLLAKADWLEETIARIRSLTTRGWTDRAITREVLGREDLMYFFTLGDLSRLNLVRAVTGAGRE